VQPTTHRLMIAGLAAISMLTVALAPDVREAGSNDEIKCVSQKHQSSDSWDTNCSGGVVVPLWSGDALTPPKITLPGGYECKQQHFRDMNVAKTMCRREKEDGTTPPSNALQ
jgi:hypothetical protein